MVRRFTPGPAVRRAALVVLTVLGIGLHGAAGAPQIAARDASLSIEIDPLPATPYQGEMVLVTIRGLYDVTIALEKLKQPDLRNFSWMQLGRDTWTSERVAGRQMTVFERRLALFPDAAGELTIGAFTHHLTLVSPGGERFVHDVVAEPVALKVAVKPKTEGGWWLPARSVTYSDSWNMDPSMMANGATAERTVRITAVGVPPAELPPPPKMVADWLIAFLAPEKRSVELTKDGPISTIEWQWRFRPARSEPGKLPAFHIPWFDTTRREMRDIVLKSQRIAFAAIAEAPQVSPVRGFLAAQAPIIAAAGGFLLVLVPAMWRRRFLTPAEVKRQVLRLLPDPDARRLKRAAVRNDAHAARIAARSYLRDRPVRPGDTEAALSDLDRRLFARGASTAGFDLQAFARRILSGRR